MLLTEIQQIFENSVPKPWAILHIEEVPFDKYGPYTQKFAVKTIATSDANGPYLNLRGLDLCTNALYDTKMVHNVYVLDTGYWYLDTAIIPPEHASGVSTIEEKEIEKEDGNIKERWSILRYLVDGKWQ